MPIDDVLRLQSLQRRADVIFRLDDKREQIRVEPPADSRRGLQQRTVFPWQPIHSGREQTLYACRQTVLPDRGAERLRIGRVGAGGGIHHRPPQVVGVGIEELELGKLLGVVLQQPGVIDHRNEDQRLAGRQRGAEPAHDRACGQA